MSQGEGLTAAQIRQRVDEARLEMEEGLARGDGGYRVCREFSMVFDLILKQLFTGVSPGQAGQRDGAIALVATGGYGRRELCAYSDVDLMLVATDRSLLDGEKFLEEILYPLWDAKLKVGHSVKTVDEAINLAKEDLPTATALLDARWIAGDKEIFAKLWTDIRKQAAPLGNADEMVSQLTSERTRRHKRFGASIYLLEPNLKQGIGALRDLATAVWVSRSRWNVDMMEELVPMGVLSPRQLELLRSGGDYLLDLRCRLQLSTQRAIDQLTFEHQEALAAIMFPHAKEGQSPSTSAVAPSVEALMRQFYLHARDIDRVSERLLGAATQAEEKRLGTKISINDSFEFVGGEIAAISEAVFVERPQSMVEIFALAHEHDAEIHGPSSEWIEEAIATTGHILLGDAAVSKVFLKLLCAVDDAGRPGLLERMHHLGVLNAILPEFLACTCRVQHDLYHVYTVDQHQLYALAMLKRTLRGEEEDGVARTAAQEVEQTPSMFLATLLHDVGKPLGKGHSEKGAVLAGRVARRLGLSESLAMRTEFLVRQHLTMTHLSQRRDLADRSVIRKFAKKVGDVQTLSELYLLTRCDSAMTAPESLSAWKDQLLGELYVKTKALLEGREQAPVLISQKTRERAQALLRSQNQWSDDMLPVLNSFPERFVNAVSSRQLLRHAKIVREWLGKKTGLGMKVSAFPMKNHTEIAFVANDRPGVLANWAGVMASHRVNVIHALMGSIQLEGQELACDLFHVCDRQNRAIPEDDPRWQKIIDDCLETSAMSEPGKAIETRLSEGPSAQVLTPPVTPGVLTHIALLNDASDEFTVLEVFAQDRVGLLHAISRVLTNYGLDIRLSKINTSGEKAEDIFYVSKRGTNQKMTRADEIDELKVLLRAAIDRLSQT